LAHIQSSEFDAPPSSQPREDDESESEGGEEVEMDVEGVESKADSMAGAEGDEQDPATASELSDDPFDGFDVAPDAKEFLQELLPHVSQAERGLLQKAREGDTYNGDRRLSSFQGETDFLEYLKNTVQDFAKEHPFWEQERWAEDDLSEFENDIHEFAAAAGMNEKQADVEVLSAVQHWKSSRGLVDEEGAVDVEAAPVPESCSKKRKRDQNSLVDKSSVSGDALDEEDRKRRKREAKKAKRNAKKLASAQVDSSQKLRLRSSQEWYGTAVVNESASTLGKPNIVVNISIVAEGEAAALATNPSTQTSKPIDMSSTPSVPKTQAPAPATNSIGQVTKATPSVRRKRKKANQGPTTSTYFTAPSGAPSIELGSHPEAEVSLPSDLAKKVEAARAAVEHVIKTSVNRARRKKKRNKNKLPEEKVREPIQSVASNLNLSAELMQGAGGDTKTSKKPRRRRNKSNVSVAAVETKVFDTTEQAAVPKAAEIRDPDPKEVRRKRSRKSKGQQDREAVNTITPMETERVVVESTDAPEASNTTNTTSHKRPQDQEHPSEDKSGIKEEAPNNPVPEAEAPRQKRPRVRRSKADWEKEQAEAAKSTPAKPEAVPPVDTSNPAEQNLNIQNVEPPRKRRRNNKKLAETKVDDIPMANSSEPLAELPDTNSKEKKLRRAQSQKSTTEMDIDPQSEKSKGRHL
jgi:hypothetical protein